MIADGEYVDGSWQLKILIDDLLVEKTLRVHGDWHVGGVMFKLVEAIEVKMSWSDHALWWPEKRRWLLHTRSTLDQYGVQADARLRFLKMHNNVRIQLPDLQEVEMRVNFSKNVFGVVVQICKELGIRHPEELSLMRYMDKEDIKRLKDTNGESRTRPVSTSGPESPTSPFGSPPMKSPSSGGTWKFPKSPRTHSSPKSPIGNPGYMTLPSPGSPLSPPSGYLTLNGAMSTLTCPASLNSLAFEGADESALARSPHIAAEEGFESKGVQRPKNFIQRARINSAWLNSSKSLMEQHIEPDNGLLLVLKFKFYNFYDLNPKYDSIRINQLYHQARWAVIAEETECTEEEMMVFAALQLQVKLQTSQPQHDEDQTDEKTADDEIDAILDQLQLSLEGDTTDKGSNEMHSVPELSSYLKLFKPRKFTLKNYKRYWIILRDTNLHVYKNEDAGRSDEPLEVINLRGSEIQADVNVNTKKYGIRLFVHSGTAMTEIWLRCPTEEVYADWMAACRLACRGKTLASRAVYDQERQTTLTFLRFQAPKAQPVLTANSIPDLNPGDYVAGRYVKRLKSRALIDNILKAHGNVREMSLIDAKLHYIKAWQRLPHYGISYFVVRFRGTKKEDLVGVAFNRIMRMDMNSADTLKTWRFNEMKSWHVNWEVKDVVLKLTKDQQLAFHPLSASCKIVHEFVGGYIFLSMRTPEKNQDLDESLFHKFTGGSV